MPDSTTVGISGASGERLAPVTARPFSLPPLTCGSVVPMPEMTSCTSPDITAAMAGAAPLNGMRVICMPASESKSSVASSVGLEVAP